MRILKEFPFSENIKASLFSWNGKYILKLEAGMLEQTYKIAETELAGAEDLLNFCANEEFQKSVNQVFGIMAESWTPD